MSAEERMQILSLLAEGKINADQAERLIAAVQGGREPPVAAAERMDANPLHERTGPYVQADTLHVRVTDLATGETRVDLSVPLGVARALTGIVSPTELARLGDFDLDLERIQQALERGGAGTVLEIDDDGHGHRVRVWTE